MEDIDSLVVPTCEHIDLSNIKSDQELFGILKHKYQQRKRWIEFFPATIRDIHFVEFEIRPKALADCLLFSQIPPLSKKAIEYEWETTSTLPPIGSKYLLYLLEHPEGTANYDTCLRRFPKKLKHRLECARGAENKGWGIYFGEKRGIGLWLAVGVVWNVKKGDMQGAWAVASWIVSVVAIMMLII